jgi:enoyl-CoA hydratase/carnithine racemase
MAQSLSNTLAAQLDYERERQCVLIEKPSFKEGVRAFQEKCAPAFN